MGQKRGAASLAPDADSVPSLEGTVTKKRFRMKKHLPRREAEALNRSIMEAWKANPLNPRFAGHNSRTMVTQVQMAFDKPAEASPEKADSNELRPGSFSLSSSMPPDES
jgi:hypothetical protein